MKTKKIYLKPCIEVVSLKTDRYLLALSDVKTYKDQETDETDEQYSRQESYNFWEEEEE